MAMKGSENFVELYIHAVSSDLTSDTTAYFD